MTNLCKTSECLSWHALGLELLGNVEPRLRRQRVKDVLQKYSDLRLKGTIETVISKSME
mgnify:CR=1 FL=1